MKLIITIVLLVCHLVVQAQVNLTDPIPEPPANAVVIQNSNPEKIVTEKIRIDGSGRWRVTRNHYLTGGLVFLAGAAKGFNEALQYQYKGFESYFPRANDQWFYPPFSFKNKYMHGDPQKGPRFPMSTSVLVMVTDQYHLNNFIQRSSLTAALVLKIGEGKKPLRHYIFDILFYSACHQLGFHSIYSPIQMRNGK